MTATNYYTISNEMVGQATGDSSLTYLTDALSSINKVVDSDGSVQGTQYYQPFGGVESVSGAWSNIHFGWVGAKGYRTYEYGVYVRARHYLPTLGSWTSRDGLWPLELPYSYVNGNPTSQTDPSGYVAVAIGAPVVIGAGAVAVVGGVVVIAIGGIALLIFCQNNPTSWPCPGYVPPGSGSGGQPPTIRPSPADSPLTNPPPPTVGPCPGELPLTGPGPTIFPFPTISSEPNPSRITPPGQRAKPAERDIVRFPPFDLDPYSCGARCEVCCEVFNPETDFEYWFGCLDKCTRICFETKGLWPPAPPFSCPEYEGY